MTNLDMTEESWGGIDRSYLRSPRGLNGGRNATLRASLFQHAAYDDGIPAGTVLGELAAEPGIFGPYDGAAADGRQTAVGLLVNPVDEDPPNTDKRYVGSCQTAGDVIRDRLPLFGQAVGTPGRLDAAAEAELRLFEFTNL